MKIGDLSHRLAVAIILTGHLGRRKKEKNLRLIFLLQNLSRSVSFKCIFKGLYHIKMTSCDRKK
jgi:hypothetical protein